MTNSDRLVTFQSDTPGAIRSSVPITGLLDGDEGIGGIDVRPADGALYGTGTAGVLYRIAPATGVAVAVSQVPGFTVNGRSFGVDFDPVADRLRLVSDRRQNLRISPVNGQATTDTALAYAAGDPNAGKPPVVVATAYTNSVAGATTTELFGLDTAADALVLQSPPDAGVLRTRGALGFNAVSPAGFDIAGSDGRAWAAFRRAGRRDVGLYLLNRNTGRASRAARSNAIATFAGRKRDPLKALASAGAIADDRTPPKVRIRRQSRTTVTDLVRGRGLRLTVGYSEACTITADLLAGKRRVGGLRVTVLGEAGSRALRLRLTKRGRRVVRESGTARLRIRLRAADLAGNKGRR